MKANKINKLKEKNIKELNTELLNLLREQLNLRIQAVSGLLRLTHLLKEVRRNIARIKSVISVKIGAQ